MKQLNQQYIILLVFFITNAVTGMEQPNQPEKNIHPYETLPIELQQKIHLPVLNNAIIFLNQQPINLPKECSFAYATKLDLDNDNVITHDNFHMRTWDIMTGKFREIIIGKSKTLPNIITSTINGLQKIEKWDNDTHTYKPMCLDQTIWKASAPNENKLAIYHLASNSNTINIININTEEITDTFQAKEEVNILALSDDILLATGWGTMQVWNLKTHVFQILKTNITAIKAKLDDNTALIAGDGKLQIWNLHTGELLKTISNFNYKYGDLAIAINKQWAVAISLQDNKAWSLSPLHTHGTAYENPLVWIKEKANVLQGNLIRRICQAKQDDNTFILMLPKTYEELSEEIKEHDSREYIDGKIYFTLPYAVRAYLRNCLRIKSKVIESISDII